MAPADGGRALQAGRVAFAVPALFWMLAVTLAAKAMGVAVAPRLCVVGLIIAAWCLAAAALVMDNRS